MGAWATSGGGHRGATSQGGTLLLGEYEQRLDDKNRVTLPARLRDQFADGVVCSRGFDGCVTVWPREAWDALREAQVARLDPFSREGRALQRLPLRRGAQLGELDRQGRIALPAPLLAHAGLGKDIVIAGLRDRLEIWDREAWRRQLAEVEGGAEHVAERLAANPQP